MCECFRRGDVSEGVIIRRARILLINGKQAEIKCHQRWKRKFAVGLDGGQDVMETGHGCDTTSCSGGEWSEGGGRNYDRNLS